MLKSLTLSANFSVLNNENPSAASRYSFESRNNSLTAYWTPWGGKWISLLGDYTRSTLRSDLSYLVPQTLRPARRCIGARARRHGGARREPPAGWPQGRRLSLGGSLFVSSGSRPTQYYQPIGRVSLPLHRKASGFGEWRWYNLGERFYLYEGFRTHHFILGLRLAM